MNLTGYQLASWLLLISLEISTVAALLYGGVWRTLPRLGLYVVFRALKSLILLSLTDSPDAYFWLYWIGAALGYQLLLMATVEILVVIGSPLEAIPKCWLRVWAWSFGCAILLAIASQIITGNMYPNEALAVYRTIERTAASVTGVIAMLGIVLSSGMGLTARSRERVILLGITVGTVGQSVFSLFPAKSLANAINTLTWIAAFALMFHAALMRTKKVTAPNREQVSLLVAISNSYTTRFSGLTEIYPGHSVDWQTKGESQ